MTRRLAVDLPEGVAAAVGAAASELEAPVKAVVRGECARIGIEHDLIVEVREVPEIAAPALSLDGAPLPYPRAYVTRAWASAVPSEHSAGDGRIVDAMKTVERPAVDDFLAGLVLSVLRRYPSQLADDRTFTPRDASMLRELLDLGITIPAATAALDEVRQGAGGDTPDHELVELAYAVARPWRVDILAHPSTLASLASEPIVEPTRAADYPVTREWREQLRAREQTAFEELGVRIPPVWLVPRPDRDPAGEFELTFLGVPVRHVFPRATSGAFPDEVLVALVEEVWENRRRLLSLAEVDNSLAALEYAFPAIVRALAATMPSADLVRVLRLLLDETICIRDLRTIADRLLEHDAIGLGVRPEAYADFVRRGLGDLFLQKYATEGRLDAISLDNALEGRLEGPASIAADDQEEIRAAVRSALAPAPASAVLLTTTEARRPLREVIAPEFPSLPVLAREELPGRVEVSVVAVLEPPIRRPASQV